MFPQRLWFLALILTTPAMAHDPHALSWPGGVAHAQADNRTCVCTYMERPTNCAVNLTQNTCTGDCRWGDYGPGVPRCQNNFWAECNNLRTAPATRAQCTSYIAQGETQAAPACVAPRTHYRYFYSGHGQGIPHFIDKMVDVINRTGNRACQFDLTDGGCNTFSNRDLVRRLARERIQPILKAGQTVVLRGSQTDAFMRFSDYRLFSPWYSFTLTREPLIVEHAIACNNSHIPTCDTRLRDAHFMCNNQNAAIETRRCCCVGTSCEWRHADSCRPPEPRPRPLRRIGEPLPDNAA